MALSRVREKYPELAALSDEDLADQLYKSHYSKKMSRAAYDKKLGLESNKTTIGEDIGKSFEGLGGKAVDIIKALPGELAKSGKQVVTHPIRAAENLAAGLGEGIIGGLNIPSNISGYLAEKDIINPKLNEALQKLHIGDLGIEKKLGLDQPQEGDTLLRGIGSFAPYSRIGRMTKGLKGLGKRSGATAAYATGQNENPLEAALMGIIGEKGVNAIANIPNLAPSKYLRGSLTPEQLSENLRATAGTETGLGDVINSPGLKHTLENKLAILPFSGVHEAQQRTAKEIHGRSENILENLLGEHQPHEIGDTLASALKEASAEAKDIKDKKFDKVNKLAESHNVMTDRSNLIKVAKNELKRIESDPHLSAFRNADEISLLKKLANEEKENAGKEFSIRDSDFLRSELGERSHEAYLNNDKTKSNLYLKLKDAIDSDINHAINKSKNTAITDARNDAMDFYKNEFAPFEEKDILKFTRRNADPDLLVQHFLKTGKLTDRSNLLNKLLTKLPEDKKGLPAYALLSSGFEKGKVSPSISMMTAYEKLGKKQKEALFPNKQDRQRIEDHSKLVGKNTEGLNAMFNPKTGWRGGHAMQALMSLLATAVAGAHGGITPGLVAGAAMHTLPGVALRPVTKALTNEKLRNALVSKMLEREPKRNLERERMLEEMAKRASSGSRSLTVPMTMELNEYAGEQE